jgi:acetamidase/formamidase
MTTHTLEPARETLHGVFSRDLAPVLTIDPGDTVRFRTLDAGWGLDSQRVDVAKRRQFSPRDPVADAGHAMSGPIAIRGAEPGMTLEIEIGELRPGGWGWTSAGGWDSERNRQLGVAGGESTKLDWTIDVAAGTASDQHGHTVALRPFMGVMGMPPAEAGQHSTRPPRVTGGNIDCRELVSGSRLFLPIAVPGGLFSTGDGHGTQGDGEVGGTAIECPMALAELTFHLRTDLRLKTPRANTPAGWLTMGFHENVDNAMLLALDAMLDLLGELHGLSRAEALALASVIVDLRVTQIVNAVSGVHALLPHDALR